MILPYESGNVSVTSPFGSRVFGGVTEFHGGIDLVGLGDKTVIAVAAGKIGASQIVTTGATAEWGNYVRIDTDDGRKLFYCHLAQRLAFTGQRVNVGDHIGIEGSTGKSTGPHLHFEVRSAANEKLNAAEYLGIDNEVGMITQIDFAAEVARKCGLGADFVAHVNRYKYASAAWRKIFNGLK